MENDSQHERKQLIELVVRHYRTLVRGPYRAEQGAQAAQQDNNSTEGLILGESEPAWRAYYAAKKVGNSSHGFSGQYEMAQLIKDLDTQSIELRRAFAKGLALAMDSVNSQLINGSGDNSVRTSAKRRCTYCSTSCFCICLIYLGPTTESPVPTPSTPNETANCSRPAYINPENRVLERVSSNVDVQEGLHVGASLEASGKLFPLEFMHAIQRVPNSLFPDTILADITMFLQEGRHRDYFGCQMEIGVAKEKVPLYARKLFNVDVETKDGVRYIHFQGGGKIEPDPCIKLRACRRDAITDIFGAEVDLAFSASPIYQREKREVRVYTDGVSMTISNREEEAGRITLFLGEWHAFNIRNHLYSW
jgi:hypothetical protein